jgi:hypothetical protein
MSKRGDPFMIRRFSPLDMGMKADRVVERNGWEVVHTYVGEKTGNPLFITDLSHVPQWSLQSRDISSMLPADMDIPGQPGEATLEEGVLIARLLREECRIMNFGTEDLSFEDPHYSKMTDAFASFAVVGTQCLEVLSRLSSVDLDGSNERPLSAAQAPVEDVTCLLLSIRRDGIEPGLIVSAPRGYGRFLFEVFQDAGKVFGMAPAGWKRFDRWLQGRV